MEHPRELLPLKEPRRRPGHGATAQSDTEQKSAEALAADRAARGGVRRRTWMLFSFFGGLIYGYNVSLAAPLQYIRDDLKLTAGEEETISATATLSDAASMLAGGWLADHFGRRASAMFACVCSIAGALLASAASDAFGWLVLWRLVTGVGNGLSILLIPMYISECVDARSRGAYLALFQLGVNAGCALPYVFMLTVSESWRACLAFGAFPALVVLYNFHFYLPESIKWLRWKSNPDGGVDLEVGGDDDLGPMSASSSSSEDERGQDDSDGTTASSTTIESQRSNKYQVVGADSISPIAARPSVELATGILLAYVNNCVDASLFYGPEIIAKTSSDYSRRDANIFGLLCSLVAVAAVLAAAKFLIEKYSRRALYLLTLAVVCVCFLLSGAMFAHYSTEDFARDKSASTAVIAVFALLNVAAAVGPSVLFVVILSELFQDNSYRARYMSYCTFAMSLISLLVNGTLLSLFETLGTAATFIVYGLSYMVCLVYFWFYLPETKSRQLV